MPIDSYAIWMYFLRCDRCGETALVSEDQDYAEERAEAAGWQIQRNGDDERKWYVLCPECVKAILGTQAAMEEEARRQAAIEEDLYGPREERF